MKTALNAPPVRHGTSIQRGGPISELLSSITAPISEAAPFGENINHDNEFAVLKDEIGKFGNLDVSLIEKYSITIIKGKAKDVRVLSFLAYSFIRKENWEGLADVFDGLTQLSEKNFDALQPDRERAKELAFKWLSEERFRSSLTDKMPTETDYGHVARLQSALTKLKSILEQKFPSDPPVPFDLFKSVEAWEKSCKPKPGALPAGTGPVPAGSAPEALTLETPKHAQGIARKGALFLIEKEPQKALGYRLMRCLRWDILEKAPPAEAGKTQLSGPPQQLRAYFQNLVAQQEWKTAIEKAEDAFSAASNHVWLDLQRIIARSCEKLGGQHAALRDAVLFETGSLIRRIPEIVPLLFSDGTPFCDEETKQWLSTDVQPIFSGGDAGAATSTPPADQFDEDRRAASALAAAGKIGEAIDLLQRNPGTSNGERESFRRSILVAELLMGAKQPDIAVAVLEMLDRKIGDFSLDRWDPCFAVDVWAALVPAYRAAKSGKTPAQQSTLQEKQYSILTKISCIDPKKALTLHI